MKDRKKRKKLTFREKTHQCDRWEHLKCERTCGAESKFISHVAEMLQKGRKLFEAFIL